MGQMRSVLIALLNKKQLIILSMRVLSITYLKRKQSVRGSIDLIKNVRIACLPHNSAIKLTINVPTINHSQKECVINACPMQ
jgi:hypothetical protein